MLIDELIFQIIQQFELQPTTEQTHVLTQFAHFMMDEEPRVVMIFGKCYRSNHGEIRAKSNAVGSYWACCQSVLCS